MPVHDMAIEQFDEVDFNKDESETWLRLFSTAIVSRLK